MSWPKSLFAQSSKTNPVFVFGINWLFNPSCYLSLVWAESDSKVLEYYHPRNNPHPYKARARAPKGFCKGKSKAAKPRGRSPQVFAWGKSWGSPHTALQHSAGTEGTLFMGHFSGVMCHMSHVMCHMSHAMCQLSHVKKPYIYFF